MAKAFAEGGASGIAICARNASKLEAVGEQLKNINQDTDVLVRPCNTTKSSAVSQLFSAIKEKWGRLDVVIANVGIANEPGTSPKIGDDEPSPDAWMNIVDTNIRSSYLTAHHYIQTFGADVEGTVVFLSSTAAAVSPPGFSSYCISKQACTRLAECLDIEYPNLKVFAMDPGVVKGIASLPEFKPFAVVEPEVVGAFAVWLASGQADGCRGGYLHAAWDIDELEKHTDEIKREGLVKTKFLGGKLGQPGGALGKGQ